MRETKMLAVVAYRDKDGEPTCALDFRTGDVCRFYRSQRMGGNETCDFAPIGDHRGYTEQMDRRGDGGMGTLIPGHWCPVWRST